MYRVRVTVHTLKGGRRAIMWANAVTISRCARLKGVFSGLQMLPCYQKVSPEVPVTCNDFVASHQAKNNTEENLLKLQIYILLKNFKATHTQCWQVPG